MDAATRELVRLRANDRCEYCHLPQAQAPIPRFHLEHIRPRKHGGTDADDNLCLACNHCNFHKASNLSGIDPLTDSMVRLFDPRKDAWAQHFCFHGARIIGRTSIGRATVRVLGMNESEQVELRLHLLESGTLA
jgi:hypothetical protein